MDYTKYAINGAKNVKIIFEGGNEIDKIKNAERRPKIVDFDNHIYYKIKAIFNKIFKDKSKDDMYKLMKGDNKWKN